MPSECVFCFEMMNLKSFFVLYYGFRQLDALRLAHHTDLEMHIGFHSKHPSTPVSCLFSTAYHGEKICWEIKYRKDMQILWN